jgi:hypothetical protein
VGDVFEFDLAIDLEVMRSALGTGLHFKPGPAADALFEKAADAMSGTPPAKFEVPGFEPWAAGRLFGIPIVVDPLMQRDRFRIGDKTFQIVSIDGKAGVVEVPAKEG